MQRVKLTIDLDREEDGRWIAEVLELPGVMCYGSTRNDAISNAERLAIEVITDRIAHGELPASSLAITFTADDQLAGHQTEEASRSSASVPPTRQ
jgi:predicted RNase H-like HicB family nuclease